MSKKNIGATLSIKDNNFTAGIRNAITGVKNLKNHTTNATGGLKKMQSQSKLTGEGLASLAKKAAGVVAAYAGFSRMISFGKECITLFDTQARSEQRLETLMMNVKGTTLENVNAMKSMPENFRASPQSVMRLPFKVRHSLQHSNYRAVRLKPCSHRYKIWQYRSTVYRYLEIRCSQWQTLWEKL